MKIVEMNVTLILAPSYIQLKASTEYYHYKEGYCQKSLHAILKSSGGRVRNQLWFLWIYLIPKIFL